MRVTTFFIFVTCIVLLIVSVIGTRGIRPLNLPQPWSRFAWAVLITAALLTAAGPIAFRVHAGEVTTATRALQWAAWLSFGFLLYAFILIVVRDAALLAARTATWFAALATASAGEVVGSTAREAISPERRFFLMRATSVASLGGAALLTGLAVRRAMQDPEVVRVTVPIRNLPPALVGLTIAQISDLHVGPTIRGSDAARLVARVNSLGADLIAVTGDLIDGYVSSLRPEVAPLAQLTAPLGVHYCVGNHEYYWGIDEWLDEARRLNFNVLYNRHTMIEHPSGARIMIAGIADYSGDRFGVQHTSDPAAACEGAGQCDVRVLLAHQPRSCFGAAKAGYDLQLSGHTHGGQFYPGPWLVTLQQPFVSGLHRHGDMWVYVNRGAGYWGPPMRLGAPPEVTLLTLAAA